MNSEGNIKCPYKKLIPEGTNANSNILTEEKMGTKSENVNHSEVKVCPYIHNRNNTTIATQEEVQKSLISHNFLENNEEEEEYTGGCPIINKAPKEMTTDFNFYYEIPIRGPNDFFFEINGNMPSKEFAEKTTRLRAMPRHLKNTLFHVTDEKMKKIRSKEFTIIYFVYEEIRDKAMKLYKETKYREAIIYFTYAYSCFKWLEFKNEEKNAVGLVNSLKLEAILDDDVVLKRCKTDDSFSYEEESFKACLVTILKSMSFAYIHLRHFAEALECLNEAIEHSDNKVPELYYRRSQARMYNKNSTLDQLTLALNDINKAIEMKKEESRFLSHLNLLNNVIEDFKQKEHDRIFKLISNAKYALNKIKEKNLNLNNHVYDNYAHIEMNAQVLEEMWKKYKYSLKFFYESKNEKQIAIAYKEIETFRDTYLKFKWYYTFDVNKLPKQVTDTFSKDDNILFRNPNFQRLILDFKLKSCEQVFSNASFNDELLNYALTKILEESKIQKEVAKKYGDKFENKWDFNFAILKTRKGLATVSTILVVISFAMILFHYLLYSKNKITGESRFK